MPEHKLFYYAQPEGRLDSRSMAVHWEHAIPCFRNAPHVWNVGGQDNVAVFLLDTGDGCILFDTGLNPETFYLTLDRIYQSGHNPRDIRKIFLTHWHWDHAANARVLQEMTGCEIWLSREDEIEHQKHAGDTGPTGITPYTVTHFYDDSKPVQMGRFMIRTRLCPGHTPGVTSFFFDDTDDVTGRTYHVALHGGLGVNPMMRPEYLRDNGYPEEMAHRFVRDCYELAALPVDIALASHYNQANIVPNIPADTNDYSVFVADYAWGDVLRNRADAVKLFYPDVYPEARKD